MNTNSEIQIKQDVRQFYDEIGWQEIGEGVYQNARYEDLRPVSWEYIHNCHLRVSRYLSSDGRYMLDAGSGPIQYPEYLEYSRGYQARVCADISIVALAEARQRIGDRSSGGKGMFVVADVANLPFEQDVFDGVVSLHTIHHLPIAEHSQAYQELYRVLAPSKSAVVVNGWQDSSIMRMFVKPIKWKNRMRKNIKSMLDRSLRDRSTAQSGSTQVPSKGTFVKKHNAEWLRREVGSLINLEIYVWRSVSVRFLRAYILPNIGGKWLLRQLYQLEERFPHFMGEHGQYPLIVLKKN
ncbi:class I SAM-dependent methyltransferase [Chloroflexota bacterium]